MSQPVNISECVQLLREIQNEINSFTQHLRFDFTKPQELYCVALHGTILEQAQSCIELIERKNIPAIPPLTRSLLEAFVNLKILVKHPEYLDSMMLEHLLGQKQINERVNNGYYDYSDLVTEVGIEKIKAHGEKVKDTINELKRKKVRKYQTREKFELAGLKEYSAVYWLLCRDAHNNLSVLEHRHFQATKSGLKISYFKSWEPHKFTPYIDMVCQATFGSLRAVTTLLNVRDKLDFGELQKNKDALIRRCTEISEQGDTEPLADP
jgi:hypothetical protein